MWRNIFRSRRRSREIDEELEAHLAIEAQLSMERGISREEANYQARRSFGNRTQTAEAARAAWVATWLDRLWSDLKYGFRTLRRDRAFTIAAVLSIALGVGSSTAIFAVADTVSSDRSLISSLEILCGSRFASRLR